MIEALNKKGFNGYAIAIPSSKELLTVLGLAAPVFVTMMSKVTIYSIVFLYITSCNCFIIQHSLFIYSIFNTLKIPLQIVHRPHSLWTPLEKEKKRLIYLRLGFIWERLDRFNHNLNGISTESNPIIIWVETI